ncbi:MAG: zinc ribbon domain-containing protein [Eubacteriales bacterium]|nr:zinc ribbon domain-containing protein [Eubacteriales bacterium]
MFDIILIVLLIKIRGNYKEAGETGASKYIAPTIVFWALAILLVLIGRSDENLTLMVLGLLCYVPAFIFSILGHKKSKNLFIEQAVSNASHRPAAPVADASRSLEALPEPLRSLVGTAAPSPSARVVRTQTCPNCGSGAEALRPLGAKGSRGTGAAVTMAFGAAGNLVAQRAAANQLITLPIEYKCSCCKQKFTVYSEQADPSELLAKPAVILLTRRSGMLGAAVARFILLNGEKIGMVKNNKSVSFQTNVRHNELLMLDQYDATGDRSPLRFDVAAGEIVRILWTGRESRIVDRIESSYTPEISAGTDPFSSVPSDFLFQSAPLQDFAAAMPAAYPAAEPSAHLETVADMAVEEESPANEPFPDAPNQFAPEHSTPDHSESNQFAPEHSEPNQSIPDQFAPNQSATVQFEPSQSVPDQPINPEPILPDPPASTASNETPAKPGLPAHGFCNRCGSPLKADARFCHVCGTTIKRGIRPGAE